MVKGEGSKALLWILLLIIVAVIIAYATGFFETEVEGGSLPNVSSDVGDVNVGSETETIEVPTLDVEEANADEE